ncbi:MAG: MotA/TolQ/ExbB proton channel family protein [Marinobacterium sp.]|nr:MotA/TolQ/ExbB proton channel family protein [Marinobacterium sp.]
MMGQTLMPVLAGGLMLALMLLPAGPAHSAQGQNLDNLLQEVRQFQREDSRIDRSREQEFGLKLAEQQQQLDRSKNRLEQAQQRQEELKQAFDGNEAMLLKLTEKLRQRSGQLGEVFGVVKQNARELQGQLQDSMVSAQLPQRTALLSFADSKRIPTLDELETLWFVLQQEATESGRVAKFDSEIIAADGSRKTAEVVRIGTFTAVSAEGQYLNYLPASETLAELPRQPGAGDQQQAAAFVAGNSQALMFDPTRGSLLGLLDQVPTLEQRLHQGGYVGYIILGLGAIGLLVALLRLLLLGITGLQVSAQLRKPEKLSARNPLGRVLQSAEAGNNRQLPLEELELQMDEAILREVPKLERGQSLIKLLAAVAPLLGLLGTVTGMIGTFQSITLFGTSDPKLMAGGISQALITTVFGLIVAIPLLFSHSLLSSRSKALIMILQRKSLGVLAQHRSQQRAGNLEVGHVHKDDAPTAAVSDTSATDLPLNTVEPERNVVA